MKKIEGHYSIVELKKRACPDVVNLDNLYQMHEAAVGENALRALQITNRIMGGMLVKPIIFGQRILKFWDW